MSEFRDDVPDEMIDVLNTMTAKNPDDRYQTPADVADALAGFVDRYRSDGDVGGGSPKCKRVASIWEIGSELAAVAVLLAGVIYLATDKGQLKIESFTDDITIVVSKQGDEFAVIDLKTDSKVTRLPSGEYEIALRGRTDLKLNKPGFTLSRGGKVLVEVQLVTKRDVASAVRAAESLLSDQEKAAHQAALAWLKLVDDKKYAASRDEMSEVVGSSVTAEQWTKKVAPVRQKTGARVDRKLKQARHTSKIPGSRVGERVILQFDSEFTNLKAASETVTAVLDKDNRWRVARYIVLPRGVSKTSTGESPHFDQEQAAYQAALTWLKLVDDKKYATSRDETSDYVRSSVTAEEWTKKVAPVRQQTGALVDRILKQARYTAKIPGSPAGERVILKFDSEFTILKVASETVTAVLDKDNRWRVARYVVVPRGVSKTSHRSADEKVVRSFDAKDTPITQTGVTPDSGGWKIVATEPGSVWLFEKEIDVTDARLVYRAKIKTEDLKGKAYLEMWVRSPGIGEAFSKGLNQTVGGTTGWATYEVPMFVKKGERIDLAKLNLAIEGQGTVWIKDVQLLRSPLPNTRRCMRRGNAGQIDEPPTRSVRMGCHEPIGPHTTYVFEILFGCAGVRRPPALPSDYRCK